MNNHLSPSDRISLPKRPVTYLGRRIVLTLGLAAANLGLPAVAEDREAPARPVATWPSGPLEVIAAFERPIAPATAQLMVGRTIPYEDPSPDRRRTPANGPAGRLRIVGARLRDDGRTLVLATDPHPRQARYLLPLPGDPSGSAPTIPYDLSGAEAAWSEGDQPGGEPKWSGWWPSLDLETTTRLARGSRTHEAGRALLAQSGRLVLSSWVRLPPGKATLRIESTGPIEEALLGDAQSSAQTPAADRGFRAELTADSRGEPLFFTSTSRTGAARRPLSVRVTYRMAGETADHPIDGDRLLLPWAPTSSVAATAAPVAIPNLSGGDPARGRTLFRGEQARCSQCHRFRGEGGQVGPDLSEIAGKGPAEIYRSVAAPSAEIAPDYTTYTVATKDGQVLSGVVRAEGPNTIQVTDTNAKTSTVGRDQVQEIRPSATSIMPPGLAAALGDSAVRDLIAYLTSPANPSSR